MAVCWPLVLSRSRRCGGCGTESQSHGHWIGLTENSTSGVGKTTSTTGVLGVTVLEYRYCSLTHCTIPRSGARGLVVNDEMLSTVSLAPLVFFLSPLHVFNRVVSPVQIATTLICQPQPIEGVSTSAYPNSYPKFVPKGICRCVCTTMATSSDLKNLQLDADDLKALVGTSKRPAVQAQLQGILAATNKQIADLESKLKAEANEIQSQGEPDAASEINATKEAQTEKDSGEQAQAADDKKTPVAPPAVAAGAAFIPIHTFGWDQSDKFVSVYVSEGMEGVKASGAKVDCQFGTDSFDLTIRGSVVKMLLFVFVVLRVRERRCSFGLLLTSGGCSSSSVSCCCCCYLYWNSRHNGKDFRLAREGLDKDIVREKSKVKVRACMTLESIRYHTDVAPLSLVGIVYTDVLCYHI